jgi:hypothetical protein
MKLYGMDVIKWEGLKEVNPTERKDKIIDAISAFIKKVNALPVSGEKLSGVDNNLNVQQAVRLINSDTIKTPDRGYEALFDEIDMRASTNTTFDILDVTGGVTFYQQVLGEDAKLSDLPTSAKTAVGFLRFIGGFPILDDWLRFNQFYKIEELTRDTIARWYDKKASIFYGLVAALGAGINQAFSTDDVTTINNACSQIVTDMAAAGYVVDENASFTLTCHPTLKARMMKALSAAFLMPNSNNNQIVFNVNALVTTTKLANTSYYISLPGVKNLRGEWEELNARPAERSELKLGADHIWTGAYNGVIAETKQHRRCSLS